MLKDIQGLHHVTSMAGNAQENNRFFTKTLGLRRVKKTINFDEPDTYHLYYGDETGSAGSLMTYFPFANARKGRPGTGEVSENLFTVPRGALAYWKPYLRKQRVAGLREYERFGEKRLRFEGPDREVFALVEVDGDPRMAYGGGNVRRDEAIQGFRGVSLRLRDIGATAELLKFMGYERVDKQGANHRFALKGNGADIIDIETVSGAPAQPGAGSVHHVAFAVENRTAQTRIRKALIDTGYNVTPVIDRNYFSAIYFQTPGGVLFEIATNEPGFLRDEDRSHLGQSLKLPKKYAHLRKQLEVTLPPIRD